MTQDAEQEHDLLDLAPAQASLISSITRGRIEEDLLMEVIYTNLNTLGTTVVNHVRMNLPYKQRSLIPRVAMVISRRINREEEIATINVDGLTYVSKMAIDGAYPVGAVMDIARDMVWNSIGK